MPADEEGELLQRRARITSAALRAAYAWSVRASERRALEEVARMTGVVMYELGPGTGPVTPTDLVAHLRRPLADLLPRLNGNEQERYGPGIDHVILLGEGDALTDSAYEIGSDYVREVISGLDPGTAWLPSWSWMRADDVEHQVFGNLKAGESTDGYVLSRRFLVEHSAGNTQVLARECNAAKATRVARYEPIPEGKTWREGGERWWWPCPECGWPMNIDGRTVRCQYGFHTASFHIRDRPRSGPSLVVVNLPDVRPRLAIPQRQAAEGAEQVDESVWRFIVVPGVSELRMYKDLTKRGALVHLYPKYDTYDLDIVVGDQRWDVDVKEHATIEGFLRHVKEKPPTARYLVLPRTHSGQVHAVDDALSDYIVLTEAELTGQVRKALQRKKKVTA